MKTIISILEVVLYNLFPATLAAPVMMMVKDIFPLMAVIVARAGIYLVAGLQQLTHIASHKQHEEPMLEMEHI